MIWQVSHEITIVLDTVFIIGLLAVGVYFIKNLNFGKDEYYEKN